MRLSQKQVLFVSLVFLFLLTGCGNNAGSGANPQTGKPDSSSTPLPSVSIRVGASGYAVGSTISITIKNQSQQTIFLTDHKTNCTVLQVERQSGGSWQPVASCKLMIATRIQPVKAGATLEVKLATTTGQWPAGTYRATLDYQIGSTTGTGTPQTIVSSEFRMS